MKTPKRKCNQLDCFHCSCVYKQADPHNGFRIPIIMGRASVYGPRAADAAPQPLDLAQSRLIFIPKAILLSGYVICIVAP